MATSTLTIPAHVWSHTEVNVIDNSIRTYTRAPNNNCKVLAVFLSPKGEDRVMRTIEGGLDEFDDTFGVGPYSIYGQPLLNARASASTGDATLQCMRLTAPDATYSNAVVWLQYKATAGTEEQVDGDTGEIIPATAPKLQVRFVASNFSNVKEIYTFNDNFEQAKRIGSGDGINAPELPEEGGWNQMPFIAVIAKGRGSYGDALSFRISNHPRADKASEFKNYYLRIFEGTRTLEGSARVTLSEDAIINNNSYFLEEVVNGLGNGTTGSPNIRMRVNTDAVGTLYELYTSSSMYPDTHLTLNDFDIILGIDKVLALSKSADYTAYDEVVNSGSGITGFEIVSDEGSTQFNTMTGIKLNGGSDGIFAMSADPEKIKAREKAIRVAYYKAFMGETCRDILSPTKFPLDAVFDADFPIGLTGSAVNPNYVIGSDDEIATRSVKGALSHLVEVRHEDCFCFMDLNTDISADFVEKEDAYEYASELDDTVNWWDYSIDAYYGKIRDPYNKKVITVTSTYNLAINYPKMWRYYSGKHIPYAGSKYGIIDQFIPNTVFPVFDVDLDAAHLDKLTDQHINYAQIDAKGNIIRGSQSTRYPIIGDALTMSNLSEINNALIILDIKKDAIKLVANYAYNFNESSEIALFNRDAEEIVRKYSEAQVKSITASFSRTDEEAELGILHLAITVVHKALVKINLVDIEVNRAVTTES